MSNGLEQFFDFCAAVDTFSEALPITVEL